MVAAAASPTDSASPDSIHHSTNNQVTYQEEMCEKLIQLSFVKIVSSKSERGGARLRKNLLILHLLQKARMEQRNRLFAAAAARSMVASQRAELTAPVVNATEADGHKTIDHGRADGDSEEEKIDVDAGYSQHENIEQHTPTPIPIVCPDDMQTSEERSADNHAQPDMLPQCDKHRHMPKDLSDSGCSDQPNCTCHALRASASTSACAGADTEVEENPTRQECSAQANSDNEMTMNRRMCLKRKHDSSEPSANQHDWISSSPKMACVMRHRTPSESSSSNATTLNELFFFKTATPNSNDETGGQGQTVAPLARSLSCSSFMELTCES